MLDVTLWQQKESLTVHGGDEAVWRLVRARPTNGPSRTAGRLRASCSARGLTQLNAPVAKEAADPRLRRSGILRLGAGRRRTLAADC